MKGYRQSKLTPSFWARDWLPISFGLVVNDFGVKYVGKQNVEHLMAALKEDYTIPHDWEGNRYLGLTLDWDYENKVVIVSMSEYVENAIQRFHHL